MKKTDIPERQRVNDEKLRVCPYCHHALRDGLAGPACDRWACWVTRTDCTSERTE